LYITERCVFELTSAGLVLSEVAPGVDLQHDILDRMEFMPLMPTAPRLMDARIFAEGLMHLRQDILATD
jgi:propionate CoA-transferase